MLLRKKLENITQVAAGASVQINCPVRPTYHMIGLEYANLTLAQMKNIRVEISGKVVQTYADGQELQDVNDYYNRHDGSADGFLPLYFVRPEFENTVLERMFAVGTMDVPTLAVQVDIDAAAVNPALSAFARVNPKPEPLNTITKVKRFPRTFATAGQKEIDSIIRGPRIMALHLGKVDVSAVQMLANSTEIFPSGFTKERLEFEQQSYGRSPISARYTHLDFCLEGRIDEMLVTGGLQELRLLPTLDTQGDLDVLVEYFDVWEGI